MLTIAHVSGVIAAAVLITQYMLPVGLVIILVAHVGTENTAATWSNINRTISNTIWPLLLCSDTVGNENCSQLALAISRATTLGAVLITLAGVTTPLGLYDKIVPGVPGPVDFQYAKDPTIWGRVTMARPDANFGRVCEFGRRINCPGQYQGVDLVELEPGHLESVQRDNSSFINSTIPANYTAMFTSATSDRGNTVSGLFDIQYRRWSTTRVDIHDNGKPIVKSDDRFVENLIPQNDVVVREGLVIDVRENPGIGFRNHTVPIDLAHGGTWTEDLTWLDPVTQCVDTNLTIEIRSNDTTEDFGSMSTVYLVDRGAFRDLDRSALESPPWTDNQTLDLFGRAYKAARMYNVFIANELNVSLPLKSGDSTIPSIDMEVNNINSTLDTLLFSPLDPELVNTFKIKGLSAYGSQTILPPEDFIPRYQNGMRKLFASNYTAIENICRGFYVLDDTGIDRRATNITNPAVSCGLLVGGGYSADAVNDGVAMVTSLNGSVIRKNMYICAGGIRASIKAVDFRYNGTNRHLPNLEVERISDKAYTDEWSKPLWAVESSEPKRMTFDPLWGIVNDSYENTKGFYTMRSDKLWLPTVVTITFGTRSAYDSLAAIAAPVLNMEAVFSTSLDGLYTLSSDYSYPLVERFNRLSSDQTSASQIPRLITTDTLASQLVGTKTAIRTDPVTYPAQLSVNDPDRLLSRANVVSYYRALRYDLRYAIPSLIVLAFLSLVVAWSTVIILLRRRILTTLNDMYNQTSTGRLATLILFPGRSDPNEPSKAWGKGDGKLLLDFGRIGNRRAHYFVSVPEEDRISWLIPSGENEVVETNVVK